MNKFWYLMMLSSLCMLLVTNPHIILSEMISASTSVISLCVELCAVYTVWLGMLELVQKSGLGDKLAKLLRPITRKLIKAPDEETEKIIALNLSANMLGLGNASTPMGIEAMRRLDDGRPIAPASMIMLLIINSTSIQLLPTTVIGLRETAGSLNASDIILPTLITTIFTSVLSVCLALLCEKFYKKRRKRA